MVVLTNGCALGRSESFCFYCGRPVCEWKYKLRATQPPNARTKDHILPKSKGGTKTVTACYGCNNEKRDLTLDEFRVVRAFRAGLVPLSEYRFAAEEKA